MHAPRPGYRYVGPTELRGLVQPGREGARIRSAADFTFVVGIERPGGFTHQVVFRRCVSCQQVNVVREDDFVCVFCDEALPSGWNIDQEGCQVVTATDDFRRSRRSTSSG